MTTTTKISLEQTMAEAKKVVEQFGPEHVNPGIYEGEGCLYDDGYGNHCIAGQIAVSLGKPIPDADTWENESPVHEVEEFTSNFDPDAVGWLGNVQNLADQGKTWAEAVAIHS